MESQDAEEWSITLPPEMARMIREKVSSGAYGSDSDVIRDALRGWLERDRRQTALDSAVARGVTDAAAGRVHGIDELQSTCASASRRRAKPQREVTTGAAR